jgi:hypothetical protein
MRVPGGRFTVGRMVASVAASAVIFALFASYRVPPIPAFAYGLVACLAILGVASLTTDTRDLFSALVAVTAGILVGAPLVQDACSPVGIFIGPIVGSIARLMTRRRSSNPRSDLRPASVPGATARTG